MLFIFTDKPVLLNNHLHSGLYNVTKTLTFDKQLSHQAAEKCDKNIVSTLVLRGKTLSGNIWL